MTQSSNPPPPPEPDPPAKPGMDQTRREPLPTSPSPFGPGHQPEPAVHLPQSLQGRYRLVRVLGKGGFANVYLAYDSVLDQQVAIKILKLGMASKSDQDRFLREARIGARLRHPNIAQVIDILQAPDGLQMIMEYCPGGTLSELVKQQGPLAPHRAIIVARQAAQALAHAHRHNFIHRDMKPANLFFSADGTVKLGDFGIAASTVSHEFTQTGMVIGTPLYMAPEQSSDSRNVDARTDIYALGLTLYFMLTGHSPRVVDLELVPAEFRGLLRAATAPERDARLATAELFCEQLDQIETRLREDGPAAVASEKQAASDVTIASPPSGMSTATTAATATSIVLPRRAWLLIGGSIATIIVLLGAIVWLQMTSMLHAEPRTQQVQAPGPRPQRGGPGAQRLALADPTTTAGQALPPRQPARRGPPVEISAEDRAAFNEALFRQRRRYPEAVAPEDTPTPTPSPTAEPTPRPLNRALEELFDREGGRVLNTALRDLRELDRMSLLERRRIILPSIEQIDQALETARQGGRHVDLPLLHLLKGYAEFRIGNMDEARRHFQSSRETNRRLARPFALDNEALGRFFNLSDDDLVRLFEIAPGAGFPPKSLP